jgi:phosphoenolpyruvate---glycerone phosphotransferase subunit DhaL
MLSHLSNFRMECFSNKEGLIIIRDLVRKIQDSKDYLSEVDGLIGDGDHGVNMNKGFSLAGERLDPDATFSDGMKLISDVLMGEIGGSMGPIYGVFFEQWHEQSHNEKTINRSVFLQMLEKSVQAVVEISEAEHGDKTLLDALSPALERYRDSLRKDEGFIQCLRAMVGGAKAGMESTKDMMARKGRSARLGERSIGVLDAGAVSCHIILESIAQSATKLITDKE